MKRALMAIVCLFGVLSVFAFPAGAAPRPLLAYVSGFESPDGMDIRIRYSDGSERRVDPEGVNTPAAGDYHVASWFSISPDGQKIAFVAWNVACLTSNCLSTEGMIYTINVDGTGLMPIYSPPEEFWVASPEWSPDGNRIMFVAYYNRDEDGRKRHTNLWVLDESVPGTWTASPLVTRIGGEKWPEWSPDGKHVVYEYQPDDDGYAKKGDLDGTTIGLSRSDGSDTHRDLTSDARFVTDAVFSPDGKWIAYADYHAPWASDGALIRVMRRDGSGKRTIASGLKYPWGLDYSPDGRFIALGEGWKWVHTRILRVEVAKPHRSKVLIDNLDEPDHLPEYFPVP